MKKLITSIFVLAVSVTAGMAQEAAKTKADNTWTFVITPQTKQASIDSVIKAWSKNSINFRLAKLKYDASGKLTQIVGNIDVKANGTHASATFKSDDLQSFKIVVDDRPGVNVEGK